MKRRRGKKRRVKGKMPEGNKEFLLGTAVRGGREGNACVHYGMEILCSEISEIC